MYNWTSGKIVYINTKLSNKIKNKRKGGKTLNTEFKEEDKLLLIQITEEIDHHTTEKLRRKMDYEITRFMPRKVMFDFSKVSFMDSAGIGLLIGRYKLAKMLGSSTKIINASQSVKKVLEMSGVVRIIPVEENRKAG